MAQALAGSQAAFEQIVRRYQRPVFNLIARMTNDPALAEDLAQETFVKAFRNLAAFDVSRRFSSWIFRIAHNTTLDALRRTRLPTRPLDEPGRPPDGAPRTGVGISPPDPAEREALGRALNAALGQLRPEYRTAIVLRYDEGLPFEEIGHVMGIPAATARTYVHRARKEMAEALTAAGWAP
ncbi:MAG TPA: sigma-70 family RNA polymerase sigma factor [Vicinamibacterales bacterium]|nr:sigma-70 family RNA polymerase sigma factor [Vicinamibacterales bacterium]